MDAAEKDPKRLKLDDDDRKEIRTGTDSDLKQFIPEDHSPADIDEISLGKEANVFSANVSQRPNSLLMCAIPRRARSFSYRAKGGTILNFIPGSLDGCWITMSILMIHLIPVHPR